MTTTTGLGSPTDPNAAGANNLGAAAQKVLSPNDFMKLLLAQLKAQDPSHPMDSNQMLQQMAAIRSIQSSVDMQTALTSVQQNISSDLGRSQFYGASQLIGRTVEVPSAQAPLISGAGLKGSVYVPSASTNVQVNITDIASKKVVGTINLGASTSDGLMDFQWDGLVRDASGNVVKDEAGNDTKYDPKMFSISATQIVNGEKAAIDPKYMLGAYKVKSVAMDRSTGSALINLDQLNGSLTIDDIIKII